MKIKSLSISNYLSFAKKELSFFNPDFQFRDDLNILIGPNGCGKSNFVAIIHSLFHRILFKNIRFEEARLDSNVNDLNYIRHTLQLEHNQSAFPVAKNRETYLDASEIFIIFSFNENDRNNLLFIEKNLTEINLMISKYSTIHENVPQPALAINGDFKEIKIHLREIQGHFEWLNPDENRLFPFIKFYLEYFNLFQHLINIANKYNSRSWPELKNTFIILGAYRNFNHFNGFYELERDEQQGLQITNDKFRNYNPQTVSEGEPPIFELVKKKISFEFTRIYDKEGRESARKSILHNSLVDSINSLIALEPLQLRMEIDRPRKNTLEHEYFFTDLVNQSRIFIPELSAGQKNMLLCIFSLFGNEIQNGLYVIDEPELHLHPQAQGDFLKMLEKAINTLSIQAIFVTHSPSFIKPKYINNIFRFYMENKATQIVHPILETSETELLRILNLTHSSRIFFCNKIILVEGETDEYFFRYLLDCYPEIFPHSSTVDIINIQGKGNYKLWNNFIERFKISCSYIGDWDNMISFDLVSSEEIKKGIANNVELRKKANNLLDRKNSLDREGWIEISERVIAEPSAENLSQLRTITTYLIGRFGSELEVVQNIKTSSPEVWSKIQSELDKLRTRNVFFLAEGELEDYLGVGKGMEKMIQFLSNEFSEWKLANSKKLNELLHILKLAYGV